MLISKKNWDKIKHFADLIKGNKSDHDDSPKKHICHKKTHFYEKMRELIAGVVENEGVQYVAINPQVDGRIKIL